MMISECLFLVCVNKTHVQSAIMLPNTKHIASEKARMNIKNKLNDVIAFHNSQKITTGRLCVRNTGQLEASILIDTPNRPKSIQAGHYAFQKCRKRFNELDLMDENGDIPKLHIRQQEYLDSHLISHAWAALHKGRVVGLITYPLIKNNVMHDKNFERYKSLARKALQTFGYVVSCDLVLNKDGELQLYNIHEEYEKKNKLVPYFTRRLLLTSHLRLTDFSDQLKQAV